VNVIRQSLVALAFTIGSLTIAYADCAPQQDCYRTSDFALVQKIDVHVHLNRSAPALVRLARQDRMQLLTINVDYPDFPPLPDQKQIARSTRKLDPGVVAYATTFSVKGIEGSGWLDKTWQQVRDDLAGGAVAVKVWKNIGMAERLSDGRPLMIDDQKLAPLFDRLVAQHAVVMGHQAEPRNCWLPLDQMTMKGDRSYFSEHPQYHMYGRSDWPDHAAQLAARDAMLNANPDLKFVAVHLASLEWDVAEIAAFLDRFPNAQVDLAARIGHLQLQASRNREAVRQFFIRYSERILYGTDLTVTPEQTDTEMLNEAETMWRNDWQFLTGDSDQSSPEFDGKFQGLALPKEVVRRIYYENARQLFKTGWR
jgi:hypothetical protein